MNLFGQETLIAGILAFLMLGLGLSLQLQDFQRVLTKPRAIVVALGCQILLLPLLAFGLTVGFGVQGELAVGMMLLAAAPGGPTANLLSHLAKGNVALNLTLTGVNAITCLLTLPLVVNFAVAHFMGSDQRFLMGPQKLLQVIAIVVIPVAIGMAVRRFSPLLAARADRPVKLLAGLFLLLLIAVSAWLERERMPEMLGALGWPVALLSAASLASGYALARSLRLAREDATAIGMEVGIHNTGFAIYIAKAVMGSGAMAVPAAVYTILAYAMAGAMAWWLARKGR
jgi:BASS family bile acid:Na+ symporter